MNRRDFCKTAAILAAGAAAMPSQIAAFEQLFDVNSRHLGNVADLIRINEIYLGGTARVSRVVLVDFYDDERLLHLLSFNGFGGIVRLVMLPDAPMFSTRSRFRWRISDDGDVRTWTNAFRGTVTYTDSDLVVHTEEMVNFETQLRRSA